MSMSNSTRFAFCSTLAAALAATALGGCSADSRVAADPTPRASALALSRPPDDPQPSSPSPSRAPQPIADTADANAAAELRASAGPLAEAGRALQQLAAGLEESSRLMQSTLRDRLQAQAAALHAEVRSLGEIDEELTRAAHALERMHRTRQQAERIERQIRAAAEKLAGAEADTSTSPDTLAELRERLASLQRVLDEYLARAEAVNADAARADQLALDAAAQIREQYPGLAARALELDSAARRAGNSARALHAVAGRVDVLLTDFTAIDGDIVAIIAVLRTAIQGPTVFWEDLIAKTLPELGPLETDIEGGMPKAASDRGSLRVLTYNTAFLSVVLKVFPVVDVVLDLNDGVFSGLDYVDRAYKIADGILRGDQDVVVLNEVFSEDARAILVQELSKEYPHYVAKLAGVPLLAGQTIPAMLLDAYFPHASELLKLLQIPGLDQYMVQPGDSGLMIFSRYPLMPLSFGPNEADCNDTACDYWGWNKGGALLHNEVAFAIFDDCAPGAADCLASKGVGLVKLQTPGEPSYVAFTHMQADEDVLEGNAWVRELQYGDVEALLTANITPQELFERRVFFAGDLNTAGHNRSDLQPSEWLDVYHTSGGTNACYACGNGGATCNYAQNGELFTDPWGFETSVLDSGLTQLNDHERLDYVLHNAMGGRACMQYVHIPYEVAEGGSHWYSDHVPMRADFNASAGACSANDEAPASLNRPNDLVFTSTNCDWDPNTPAPPCQQDIGIVAPQARLTHAGSFQWYRITQAGSYSIKIEGAAPDQPVDFLVYQGEDLSRPIEPFDDEEHPRWGKPFAMLEPPYYVRVFAVDGAGKPDRSAASAGREYRIDFHQHLCRDAEDACLLPSAFKYPYIWPEVTAINTIKQLFFKMKTSGLDKGHLTPQPSHYPMVRFQEESILGSNLDCLEPLELLEYQGLMPPMFVQAHPFTSVETDVDQDWDEVDGPDRRYIAPDLEGDTQDEFKLYYVKMSRKSKPECDAPFPTNLRFETNLTYFRAGRVRCYLQADDSGIGEDDEMLFHPFFDEQLAFGWDYCDNNPCHQALFDEPAGDNWLSDVASLQGYFVDEMRLGMWENNVGADQLLDSDPIKPTPPSLRKEEGLQLFVTDDLNPDKADYSYRVEFILCREHDDCDVAM